MRKRHIKSVAHWVIMCFILLFPIVMVGISSFSATQQEIHVTETYEYETNDVNNVDDLVVGNIYHLETTNFTNSNEFIYCSMAYNVRVESVTNYDTYFSVLNITRILWNNSYINTSYLYNDSGIIVTSTNATQIGTFSKLSFDFVYQTTYLIENEIQYISASDYLGEKTIDYNITDQTMRDDVNEWCASFRNLPVNQWYGDMLVTIGLGITTSMMMNVIYTYPLYVLWVYIIDLLVDCLLVIINFGHNVLKRLGGENE